MSKMSVTRKLQARGVTDVDRVGVRVTYRRARHARGTHRVSGGVQWTDGVWST
ncbi:MAG TPA: hypothetical protein VII83_02455 [Gaiellaceae bacterium]